MHPNHHQFAELDAHNSVWKRSQGRTSEAPPEERGGNRYVRPTATAPHSDSTRPSHSYSAVESTAVVTDFRMPARHRRVGCTEAGVRKASMEETAGGVRADAGVGLWGICRPSSEEG